MKKVEFPNSTSIEAIYFSESDESDCNLHVKFVNSQDEVYKYFEVPLALAIAMEEADSAGRFFHNEIKSNFGCEKVPASQVAGAEVAEAPYRIEDLIFHGSANSGHITLAF